MSNGGWKTSFPLWGSFTAALVAAGATVALALFAWLTLDPVVDNLKLRQENVDLSLELRTNRFEVAKTKEELTRVSRDLKDRRNLLKIARQDLKGAREDLSGTRAVNKELSLTARKLAEGVTKQQEIQNRLSERNLKLERQTEELTAERARLKTENVQLGSVLKGIKSQLESARKELEINRRAQRAYILETLVTKVKSQISPIGTRVIHFRPSPLTEGFFKALGAVKGLKSSDVNLPKNPRITVVKLFGEREWDLLREDERRQLQQDVRDFMDDHKKIFDSQITFEFKLAQEFINSYLELRELRDAKEFNEEVEIEKGSPKRVPTSRDIQAAQQKYDKLSSANKKHLSELKMRTEKLYSTLDQMVRKLAPARG